MTKTRQENQHQGRAKTACSNISKQHLCIDIPPKLCSLFDFERVLFRRGGEITRLDLGVWFQQIARSRVEDGRTARQRLLPLQSVLEFFRLEVSGYSLFP